MNEMKERVRVLLVGMLMGAAEVVPGVSGGTIAFISGVYEQLLNAIRQFTPYLIVRLRHDGFISLWKQLDINFLLLLFGGMGVSILLFASGVSYLLENEPIIIWSFFFGLVIASAGVVVREIDSYDVTIGLAIGCGIAFGIVVTNVVPLNLEPSPWTLFFGGAIAVCAWILPGLSGSFILLILGLYAYVIDAVKSLAIVDLAFVAAGCAVGIVSFAQVLSALFARFRNETLAVLTGFMLGSLGKLWPWKQTTSYQLKPDGSQIPLVQEPITPAVYQSLTGQDPQLVIAIGCAVFGLIIVGGLNFLADSKPHGHEH